MTVGLSALDPAMVAMVQRLSGDATFAGVCTGGVYDAVKQGTSFPYAWVTVRETPKPMETFGRMGFELEWRIQVYDKDGDRQGTQRIDQILGRLAALVHHQPLAMTGFTVDHVNYEGAMPMGLLEDSDGVVVRSKVGIVRGLVEAA